jgi:hypothetical protein
VIQFVDYRAQDKQAAYAMVKSLHGLPESAPLPDPLPPEPPVPISYLGDLRAQIEAEGELNLARQRDLLFELKRRLKDAESREDAVDLMRLLRGREELLATIAEEIDAILDHRKGERNHLPGDNTSAKENLAGHDSSPYEIDLNGDGKGLEALVNSVVTTSRSYVLTAAGARISISSENGELVLVAAVFQFRGGKFRGGNIVQRFKARGWSPESTHKQRWAPLWAPLLVGATYGLILLHKGARQSLLRDLFVKRFSFSQRGEATLEIVAAFQILSPESTTLVASKV